MNNLVKREALDLSPITKNPWVKGGLVIIGGYVALKVTFGLIGLAWTIASWLFWPAVIVGLGYFLYKKYLRN